MDSVEPQLSELFIWHRTYYIVNCQTWQSLSLFIRSLHWFPYTQITRQYSAAMYYILHYIRLVFVCSFSEIFVRGCGRHFSNYSISHGPPGGPLHGEWDACSNILWTWSKYKYKYNQKIDRNTNEKRYWNQCKYYNIKPTKCTYSLSWLFKSIFLGLCKQKLKLKFLRFFLRSNKTQQMQAMHLFMCVICQIFALALSDTTSISLFCFGQMFTSSYGITWTRSLVLPQSSDLKNSF